MYVSIRSRATGARRREVLAPGLAPAADTGGAGTGTRASVHLCGEGSTARFGYVLRGTRQMGPGDAGRARRGDTRIRTGHRHALNVQWASFRRRLGARHAKHAGRGHTPRSPGKLRRTRARSAKWAHTGRRQGAACVLNAVQASMRQRWAQIRAWYARTAARGGTRQACDKCQRGRAGSVRRGSTGRTWGAAHVRNARRASI